MTQNKDPYVLAEDPIEWLRECADDPHSPSGLKPDQLGMLTGQDRKTLRAIACCWQLFFAADQDGEAAAINSVAILLGGLQPKCYFFARELIAFAGEWTDRDRVWRVVELKAHDRKAREQLPPW